MIVDHRSISPKVTVHHKVIIMEVTICILGIIFCTISCYVTILIKAKDNEIREMQLWLTEVIVASAKSYIIIYIFNMGQFNHFKLNGDIIKIII